MPLDMAHAIPRNTVTEIQLTMRASSSYAGQTDMRSQGNKFGDCYLPLISECGREGETETEKAAGTFSEQLSGFVTYIIGLGIFHAAIRLGTLL